MLAVAAYNGGLTNVDGWVAQARCRRAGSSRVEAIPFPETREYVQRVLERPARLPRHISRGSSGLE